MLEIRTFEEAFVDDAADLFVRSHAEARRSLPLIPERGDLRDFTRRKLSEKSANAGFAAFQGGRLVGYMVEFFAKDDFMGMPTGFVLELYPCTAESENRCRIYQHLYRELSRSWVDRGFHAHQISFFATDRDAADTFFMLGFGMTHFQLFRDLSVPSGGTSGAGDVRIRYLENESEIWEIDNEHNAYYPNAPLFWIPHDYFKGPPKGGRWGKVRPGEQDIVVAEVDGKIAGYFVLRRGTAEAEIFVDPGNGQIKAAYCRPEYWGRGIGRALLAESVRWAKRHQLERLYVEGESANLFGSRFWTTHFEPAEYCLRRCVDNRIIPEMFSEG